MEIDLRIGLDPNNKWDVKIYKTAELVYQLSKKKPINATFEGECQFYADCLDISVKKFKSILGYRITSLSMLPDAILKTIEDWYHFAVGLMSKRTQRLLKIFLKQNKMQGIS